VLRLVRAEGVRTITITGPPGIGKRRFAAEVAAELRPDEQIDLAAAEEPRGVAGEWTYRLRPLAEAPAVELFRQHAEAADPGFDAPYAEIARVCRRIGRLPLAIELAAARPRDALAELAERPSALAEVVAWTCARLGAREREVLAAVARDPAAAGRDSLASGLAALAALHLVDLSETGLSVHPSVARIATRSRTR
jgi:hypothetical protein